MPLSTFLDGRSYTQLRGAAWLALSDVGHVQSGSVVSDGGGGGTTVFTSGSAVPCRIDPLTGNERLVASQIADQSTHVVTFAPDVTVALTDRIEIDGRGTFEVIAIRDRTREWLGRVEVVQA
jgi:uncharacterized protein YndB with AHSA1/START domain